VKITVPKIGEIEVKDISYGQARELHRLNAKTFWGAQDGDEMNVDPDKYYDMLEQVRKLSGLTDKELKKYSMVEVDVILQQILMEYTGINPKD
jgi:hypothetical protein|tara:strand:- start:219 stop:497 length:279 start_codon:yes stop_codon:yes gene_type:complete